MICPVPSPATVNGTAALHTALHLAGVRRGELVITQALTFVATCNAMMVTLDRVVRHQAEAVVQSKSSVTSLTV